MNLLKKQPWMKKGGRCMTPYGPGIITSVLECLPGDTIPVTGRRLENHPYVMRMEAMPDGSNISFGWKIDAFSELFFF